MEIDGIVEHCITYGGNKRTQFRLPSGRTIFAFTTTVPITNGNYVRGNTMDTTSADFRIMRDLKIYDRINGRLLHEYNNAYCPESD